MVNDPYIIGCSFLDKISKRINKDVFYFVFKTQHSII
jgi:hypothetical protein